MPAGYSQGADTIRKFLDSFNRASGHVGLDWLNYTFAFGGNGCNNFVETRIGDIGGFQGLICNSVGINNPTLGSNILLYPVKLIPVVAGKSQYAKITVQSVTNAGGSSGLFIFAKPGQDPKTTTQEYYILEIITTGTQYRVTKFRNGVNTVMIAAAALGALPATIEFRGILNANSTTLTVLVNGVQVATVDDVANPRPISGSCGVYGEEVITAGVGSVTNMYNFEGGLL